MSKPRAKRTPLKLWGATHTPKDLHARFAIIPRQEPGKRDHAALRSDHPAVVEGHTLFPTRVFGPADRKWVLVSGINNAKIGKKVTKGPWAGFPIFTLSLEERASCPRSCAVWAECYGNSLPMAVRFRYGPELIEALDTELHSLSRMHPRGFVVRLHVLGDFPDLQYVARWREWLGDIPQLHVWGYTAHPADSAIWPAIDAININWPARWSVRSSVAPETRHGRMQAAVIWTKPEDTLRPDDILCPAETGKTATCGTCGVCWAPAAAAKRIVFMGHGMTRRGPGTSPEKGKPGMDVAPAHHIVPSISLPIVAMSRTEIAPPAIVRNASPTFSMLGGTLGLRRP